MPNKNLTTLENAIYNSIPRLRELSVGCEILVDKNILSNDLVIEVVVDLHKNKNFVVLKRGIYQIDMINTIIGHPILLNDVLEWLNNIKSINVYQLYPSGRLFKNSKYFETWNLSKPKLSDQSQELIDALTELIPK